ncbi:MAG TPA: hypothetical protein VN634_09855 [Candidatus Limnocylindrales bacterium]|nr:hypothetical protein [Candidatus Limnocylindrales bacterium]
MLDRHVPPHVGALAFSQAGSVEVVVAPGRVVVAAGSVVVGPDNVVVGNPDSVVVELEGNPQSS